MEHTRFDQPKSGFLNKETQKRCHLKRYFSKQGICSRTEAEKLIRNGHVQVNGKCVRDPCFWVDTGNHTITFSTRINHKKAEPKIPAKSDSSSFVYLALHKPTGFITAYLPKGNTPTVYEFIKRNSLENTWVFPVGRLDKESEGLLLFTNDGVFSNIITSPQFPVCKTYRILLDRLPRKDDVFSLTKGISLDGVNTLPCTITHEHGAWFRVALHEGRNRQIRRMFWSIGCKVKRLIRIRIGDIELGSLASGMVRALSSNEIHSLYSLKYTDSTE